MKNSETPAIGHIKFLLFWLLVFSTHVYATTTLELQGNSGDTGLFTYPSSVSTISVPLNITTTNNIASIQFDVTYQEAQQKDSNGSPLEGINFSSAQMSAELQGIGFTVHSAEVFPIGESSTKKYHRIVIAPTNSNASIPTGSRLLATLSFNVFNNTISPGRYIEIENVVQGSSNAVVDLNYQVRKVLLVPEATTVIKQGDTIPAIITNNTVISLGWYDISDGFIVTVEEGANLIVHNGAIINWNGSSSGARPKIVVNGSLVAEGFEHFRPKFYKLNIEVNAPNGSVRFIKTDFISSSITFINSSGVIESSNFDDTLESTFGSIIEHIEFGESQIKMVGDSSPIIRRNFFDGVSIKLENSSLGDPNPKINFNYFLDLPILSKKYFAFNYQQSPKIKKIDAENNHWWPNGIPSSGSLSHFRSSLGDYWSAVHNEFVVSQPNEPILDFIPFLDVNGNVVPGNFIGGLLEDSLVLEKNGKYHLHSQLVVGPTSRLTIEEGVELLVHNGCGDIPCSRQIVAGPPLDYRVTTPIQVLGRLEVHGTAIAPVYISSLPEAFFPTPIDNAIIQVADFASAFIKYTSVNAGQTFNAVKIHPNGRVDMEDSWVYNYSGAGIQTLSGAHLSVIRSALGKNNFGVRGGTGAALLLADNSAVDIISSEIEQDRNVGSTGIEIVRGNTQNFGCDININNNNFNSATPGTSSYLYTKKSPNIGCIHMVNARGNYWQDPRGDNPNPGPILLNVHLCSVFTSMCSESLQFPISRPLAEAGSDVSSTPGAPVFLDASASSDADNNIINCSWYRSIGQARELVASNPNCNGFWLTMPVLPDKTLVIFELEVTDADGFTDTDTTHLIINPFLGKFNKQPPVANPGADFTVAENSQVLLDAGASTDSDGNVVSYEWQYVSGPSIEIAQSSASPTASFKAPSVTSNQDIVIQLKVTDNEGLFSIAPLTISVQKANNKPIAIAGNDIFINESGTVALNGNASGDTDGSISSYQWTQISGPAVVLSSSISANVTFTAPSVSQDTVLTFRLTVMDNLNASSSDQVSVIVKNVGSQPAQGTPVPPGPVATQINADSIFTAGSTYEFNSTTTINTGNTITIEAGAILKFTYGSGLVVDGTLVVQGTTANPVIFTADFATPYRGFWSGIQINSTSSESIIEGADIQWAQTAISVIGTDATIRNNKIREFSKEGIKFTSGAGGTIDSNEISNSTGTGIYLKDASADVAGFGTFISGNTIKNNGYGIQVLARSAPVIDGGNFITQNSNGVWVTGDYTLAINDPLPVINSNAIFNNTSYNLYIYGYSDASRTIEASLNWWGSTDLQLITEKVFDKLDASSYAPVTNILPILDGINGNPTNSTAFVGPITAGQTRTMSADGTYDILGPLKIEVGGQLTIDAGAMIRIHGIQSDISIDGDLTVVGTSVSPITFTTSKLSPYIASWQGVKVNSGATASFDHARIFWAKDALQINSASVDVINSQVKDFQRYGIRYDNVSSGRIENNVITHQIKGNAYGIYLEFADNMHIKGNRIENNLYGIYAYRGSSATINNANTITNNSYGIYAYGDWVNAINDPVLVTNNNNIHTNSVYDFYAYGYKNNATVLNSTNNWWGTTDTQAINAKIFDIVDVSAFAPSVNISPILTSSAMSSVEIGEALYVEHCSSCHGPEGSGGSAPSIIGSDFSVIDSKLNQFHFGSELTSDQRMFIASYLTSFGSSSQNFSPTANAGANQIVSEGDSVVLDGSLSTDPDGFLSYMWNQTAGPVVSLTNNASSAPGFTAPQVSSDTTLSFTLTVTDNLGASDTASTDVTVLDVPPPPAAPQITLSASPNSITSGQSSTITWSTTNASACSASGAWSGTKAISGSQSFQPTATSTYTMQCTGAGGSASQSVTVTVNAGGGSYVLSANPTVVSPGESITLSWTTPTSSNSSFDWVGIYQQGAVHGGYINWKYTQGVQNGTWTVTAPTTPGTYEFRYFINNAFVLKGTSNQVVVQ